MKNYHFYSKQQSKTADSELARSSTEFLKMKSNFLSLKFPAYKFGPKRKKDKKFHNTHATFLIKKNIIMESIENPQSELNEIWNYSKTNDKNCTFFPFIQERDHLNRLISNEKVNFINFLYIKMV